MRRVILVMLVLLASLASAEEVTGALVKTQGNRLELKSEPDHHLWALELKSGTKIPSGIKVGDRITVDYTAQRVAIAQNGQRQCVQFLTANSVKAAATKH